MLLIVYLSVAAMISFIKQQSYLIFQTKVLDTEETCDFLTDAVRPNEAKPNVSI